MTTIARLRELVDDCNELINTRPRLSTHWSDCHKSHPYCAIYKLTDALPALLDVVEAAKEMRGLPAWKDEVADFDAALAKLENNN